MFTKRTPHLSIGKTVRFAHSGRVDRDEEIDALVVIGNPSKVRDID
jgi:hypothetical protein